MTENGVFASLGLPHADIILHLERMLGNNQVPAMFVLSKTESTAKIITAETALLLEYTSATHNRQHSKPTSVMELPTIIIEPSAPHTHTVVFLHGRGDTAKNFARTLGYSLCSGNHPLYGAFPSFRWVFPQAPIRRCANGNGYMHQWFDTWSSADFSLREELQVPGLKEIVPAIQLILAAEAERLGGRWDKVVLAGISMGGATSAHVMFNLAIPPLVPGSIIAANYKPNRLAALMTFSSRCPYVGRPLEELRKILNLPGAANNSDVLRNTPMLLEHCIDDDLVPIDTGRSLRDTMTRFGAQVTWKEYPDGGHWFNAPTGIDDVVAFLKSHLFDEQTTTTHLIHSHPIPK